MMVINREVRKVPVGWEHPRGDDGKHIPTYFDDDFLDEVDFGPLDEECELVMYESTSEGTPRTPAFPDTPQGKLELVNYCVKNCTVYGTDSRTGAEAWAAILFGQALVVDASGRIS